MVFKPPPPTYTDKDPGIFSIGGIYAYMARPDCFQHPSNVIVICHGSGSDLGTTIPIAQQISNATGIHVLTFDYTGYGPNQSQSPSFDQCVDDLRDVLEYTQHNRGYLLRKTILVGWSIGSGPSCVVASTTQFHNVILVSPVASVYACYTGFVIPLLDEYAVVELSAHIACPLHVLHGTHDTLVPFEHGQRIYNNAAIKGIFKEVEEAGHADVVSVMGTDPFLSFINDCVFWTCK